MSWRTVAAASAVTAAVVAPLTYTATVNAVRSGIHQVVDEAANRSTPTGRQVDDDLSLIIRQQVDEAIECNNLFGDPRCIGEGAPTE